MNHLLGFWGNHAITDVMGYDIRDMVHWIFTNHNAGGDQFQCSSESSGYEDPHIDRNW